MPFKIRFIKLLRDAQTIHPLLVCYHLNHLPSSAGPHFPLHNGTLSNSITCTLILSFLRPLALLNVCSPTFSPLYPIHNPSSCFSISPFDWFGGFLLLVRARSTLILNQSNILQSVYQAHRGMLRYESHGSTSLETIYSLIAKWEIHVAKVSVSLCSAKLCD